ncbi:MAG: universal stress protein [Flavobacteriaceae bacterium]
MKNILLPTDFSENAQKAIKYAVSLFAKEPCQFYLLHAYYNIPSSPGNKFDAEKELNALVNDVSSRYINDLHTFEGVLLVDNPLNAINTAITDKEIDFVFMGTKGASGLRTVFLGSNTAYVIKHIDTCPIVAVPALYDHGVPEEIAFANDFKKEVDPRELNPLIKIAKLWDSEITVVHIDAEEKLSDMQKLNRALLRNSFKNITHRFAMETMDLSVSSTIRRMEIEHKTIGMVAMLKNKHGFIEKLMREPVIRNVTFTTEVPFLVLPSLD